MFNHRTNIDIHNRLVCFDIKELGKQLKKLGMLIIQDQVWGRVTENRELHANTWFYCDEFHLLLKEEQTAAYSVEIWLTHDFCAAKGIEKINGRMFRYIYPLTKEAENILNSYPQYTGLRRPKDKDLYFAVRTGQRQYRQIPPPRFNREVCRYNPQKYGQAERR